MARLTGLALLAVSLLLASGCTVCCAPFDDHYLYTGGRWVRHNPNSGRVGSAFDPAGSRVEGDDQPQDAPVASEPTPAPLPGQDGTQSVLPDAEGNSYLPLNE